MTNCGKGKANTVHPECIGEQHYSDDHGTGSAIKMAKAPDVDLEKDAGQAAPDPTVANALEKARDEGVPSKKGRELKPFKGKEEKIPVEGENSNYPGYTKRKVPTKSMSTNQTDKQTHQDNPGAPLRPQAPDGRVLNATKKTQPAPKATREERSTPYREAAEADKADLDFWQRATDIYNGMPGSKGNWDAHLFRTIYGRMFTEDGEYTGYKSDNPAFVNAVRDAKKQADWMNRRDASIAQSNDEALHPENHTVSNSKRDVSDAKGRTTKEDPSTMLSFDQSEKNRKMALKEQGLKDPKDIKYVQTKATTALSPTEIAGRKANESPAQPDVEAAEQKKKRGSGNGRLNAHYGENRPTETPEPIGSGRKVKEDPHIPLEHISEHSRTSEAIRRGQTTPYELNQASEEKARRSFPDTRMGARAYETKRLTGTNAPVSQETRGAVTQAAGGLGTPDAVKLSAERLREMGILTQKEQHKDAVAGVEPDVSRATDRRSGFTIPAPATDGPEATKARERSLKPMSYKVDTPPKVKNMSDESKSARTDTPSFDELQKSSVKDLAVMWNDLMKSSDMEKAWAHGVGSGSDDEKINEAIDDARNEARLRGAKKEDVSADTDTERVNDSVNKLQTIDRLRNNDWSEERKYTSGPIPETKITEKKSDMEKSEETNTVEQPNVIQKSFKEIMDEGSEKKIGTMGAPAGSNPYGYPLGGISMPIMNGYQQVFISREDRVMPTVGQMKHTKN